MQCTGWTWWAGVRKSMYKPAQAKCKQYPIGMLLCELCIGHYLLCCAVGCWPLLPLGNVLSHCALNEGYEG